MELTDLTELNGQRISVRELIPLMLVTSAGWVITIEGAMTVSGMGETSQVMSGGELATVKAVAEQAEGLEIQAAVINGGVLAINFSGGMGLEVKPDPDYEAWNVSGPGTRLIVCMPGGELAIWS